MHVLGADILDGTPIFDIKPYIPYCDSHPDAKGGFTATADDFLLEVDIPEDLLKAVPAAKQDALIGVLSHDPRPSYQEDENRIYGMAFGGYEIKFTVKNNILCVSDVAKIAD